MLPPAYPRAHSSQQAAGSVPGTPRGTTATMHVKRVTLTSKKNWWMVEMNEEDEMPNASGHPFEEAVMSQDKFHITDTSMQVVHDEPQMSPPIFNPPRHPTSIFAFPTPTAYSAPPNPTTNLAPCAQGSASELFKCIVKKPDVVQLEINGEMQSNASDVTTQFLAELRVYTTVTRHRNIAAFLGSLENVGMVLEFVEGRTLYDVVNERPVLNWAKKIDYHNQLLAGLTHLHSYGFSHGDLSLSNIQVTHSSDTIKLLDFGRSVDARSTYASPTDSPPSDPLRNTQLRKPTDIFSPMNLPLVEIEQIHPGTRPFSAPEVLRGECLDARLADAYSFGMVLVCLDRCESVDMSPWEQRKDKLASNLFDGCEVFEERAREYLRKWNADRRRLVREDILKG